MGASLDSFHSAVPARPAFFPPHPPYLPHLSYPPYLPHPPY